MIIVELSLSRYNTLIKIKRDALYSASLFRKSRKDDYPNILNIIPAATAEPITPATFGPIACISK